MLPIYFILCQQIRRIVIVVLVIVILFSLTNEHSKSETRVFSGTDNFVNL
jgi:hypothetical protein